MKDNEMTFEEKLNVMEKFGLQKMGGVGIEIGSRRFRRNRLYQNKKDVPYGNK